MDQQSPNETGGRPTMQVEAVAAAPRSQPVPIAPPPPQSWGCHIVARLLSGLLRRPVTTEEILHKAIALGLLRQPGLGRSAELDTRATARLLLSGYQLPAHIEEGSLLLLESHLAGGRRAWVVLQRNETAVVYQVFSRPLDPSAGMSLREVGGRFVVEEHLSVERFVECWTAAGRLLVVAATAWADLPATGALFFGGLRDRDGSYHWVAAECDTDREGHILRY
jgi:hypothetical protein